MADDHLSPDMLASLAVSGAEGPAHLGSCAACRGDLASLQRVVADLQALPEPPAHLMETAKAYFRRRRSIEALIEKLIEDPALREKALTRPESVLRDAGLEPDQDLIEALREIDRPSGDLVRRIAAKSFLH